MSRSSYAIKRGACSALASRQGCVTNYVPGPSQAMVTVRAVGFGRPQICNDCKFYWFAATLTSTRWNA